ncbi:hypothetical protein, conserved [Trypanosoma brucei gambiense DAL972]|uniref:Phosphotyrosine protein phosphatase I domain-containing protein n=3 Tax=Trypanosoma brucei TaxID=5691 RepID=Q38FI3_TRYB2|nr:hypothetical protein, conserved [Trypanosoma brucei gambiense DAL972]XP_803650.1 hypothetical protein, conserved [Trypanosoma brucei brucei TREU927]6SGA_FW Chain FW, mt-SAF26 [Trypanosoma brucei brucei]6SGB_FW Chain FW, mt-SAF26 [Trypanosoma brucei brucei]7PUA_FW Chain FW, LMWPc domain-containing protein [Trypanosoma brucei brucei]RHW70474.1 low molecular weight protein tyrosine phosphatase [Trypanosoma brucei equiperdum]EAN76437.1 hypothetical protein, conserved [Trypanosoma brucei brucei|eukprot:XP_011776372.1 hypothetical protein, conserved [Trypanosoma brucei gambiense DAL972]
MSTSSRGILIAGLTNRARTQMAEGILRRLTAGTIFIKSGGVHHESTIHPLAVKVMKDIGIDISKQSVTSLEAARRQQNTYDVYISIDCSYERRTLDKSQPPRAEVRRRESFTVEYGDDGSGPRGGDDPVRYDPLLVPRTPSHWSVGVDATDVRRRWQIWSPRDPSIFHETSTRKFQDHLYEGEPLFMQLRQCPWRTQAKVSERWEMDEVAIRYPVERHSAHELRFVQAREQLLQRSFDLLTKLEKHYGERLLLDRALLEEFIS